MFASGRYATLDDGIGFSLVPWKPVIEQRLGQQIAATVHGGGVTWEIGRAGPQSSSENWPRQRRAPSALACLHRELSPGLASIGPPLPP